VVNKYVMNNAGDMPAFFYRIIPDVC